MSSPPIRTETINFRSEVFSAERGDKVEASINHPSANSEQIDHRLAKQHVAYYAMANDLQKALEAFEAIKRRPEGTPDIVVHSLVVTAVLSYARCFTQSDGRGCKLHDHPPWVPRDGDDSQWHKQLMDLRHEVFAHAGKLLSGQGHSVVYVDNAEQPSTVLGVGAFVMDLHSFGTKDIDAMIRRVSAVHQAVQAKQNQLGEQLSQKAAQMIAEHLARSRLGAPFPIRSTPSAKQGTDK